MRAPTSMPFDRTSGVTLSAAAPAQRVAKPGPARVAAQRLEPLQAALLATVPQQPLRALDASGQLCLRRLVGMAQSSHAGQQMLEAHTEVEPIKHSLGWPRQPAGERHVVPAVGQHSHRRVGWHAGRGEKGLLPRALVWVVRASVSMRTAASRLQPHDLRGDHRHPSHALALGHGADV